MNSKSNLLTNVLIMIALLGFATLSPTSALAQAEEPLVETGVTEGADNYIFNKSEIYDIGTIYGFQAKAKKLKAEAHNYATALSFLTTLSKKQPKGDLAITNEKADWLASFKVVIKSCDPNLTACVSRDEIGRLANWTLEKTVKAQAFENAFLRGLRAINSDQARVDLQNILEKNRLAREAMKEEIAKRTADLDQTPEAKSRDYRQKMKSTWKTVTIMTGLTWMGLIVATAFTATVPFAVIGVLIVASAVSLGVTGLHHLEATDLDQIIKTRASKIEAEYSQKLKDLENQILIDAKLSVLANDQTVLRP